jgi:ech hydrogenase subunit A
MLMMLGMLLILPLSFLLLFGSKSKKVGVYMAGENTGDDQSFHAALGKTKETELSNWYMEGFFGEKKLFWAGAIGCAAFIAVIFSIMITRVM